MTFFQIEIDDQVFNFTNIPVYLITFNRNLRIYTVDTPRSKDAGILPDSPLDDRLTPITQEGKSPVA